MAATDAVHVDASNAQQLQAWNGDEGAYWSEHADSFERSSQPFHHRLLDAAAIRRSDRVLDVGCGTGQTTRGAARAAANGNALGVDLSSTMLADARRRAAHEGIANVSFLQADAQIHPFEGDAYDIVISNTGATFFGDVVAGLANLRGALRPGGRLVLLTWQALAQNEWIRELRRAMAAGRQLPVPPAGAQGPFALAQADHVRAVLDRAHYTGVEIEGAHLPFWTGASVDDAYEFLVGLLGWMLDGLDASGRRRALDALRATLAAHETVDGVVYDSAIWVIRAMRPPG
jgi:ubiquinone/menaquinone biosynthesis C-methylase UbiE